MNDERLAEAFGELDAYEEDHAREVVDRLSTAIADLVPLMNGDDGAGELRVGAMLVGLGRKIAGVE